MSREILLPPAVLDLIQEIQNPRGNIHIQDHLLARLEAIEVACRLAAETFRKRRLRKMESER